MANSSDDGKEQFRDGYDIPLYGMDNGTFYYLHIPAIICISSSFVCATTSIIVSLRNKRHRHCFTTLSKSERFVIYIAICDGLFNLAHFSDHFHIIITRDMVRPRQLCQFYGFNLAVFSAAQCLMVNIVAVNIFLLIFFEKNLKFGRYDWKLILVIFGVPFLGSVVVGCLDQLGPNGI